MEKKSESVEAATDLGKLNLFFQVCLASYLEQKGFLDRLEFADFLEKSRPVLQPDIADPNLLPGVIQTLKSGSHLRVAPRE